MPSGRPDLPSISVRAMATSYLRWILSTHSRSTLKMKGFEQSIDLDFENGFFQTGYQLNIFFLGAFLPSSRWSRETVKMEGFELAATLVATSDFQNFFGGLGGPQGTPQERENAPSSLLCSALDSRNRIPSFLQGIMSPRNVLHCKYEAIRDVAKNPEKMR